MSPADFSDIDRIVSVEQLEEVLSRPTPEVVETMGRIDGDLIVLGIAGKIGPSLARMARRASDTAGVQRRIVGVARFSTPGVRESLERDGIETIACDLLDHEALAALPEMPNVLYLPARKFGSTGDESLTWAMNTLLAARVCEKYAESRIVAYSTGNVYPLMPIDSRGATESTPLAAVGEYGMSCVGRERVFEYYSRTQGTPVSILRLNYAQEPRYGILVDLAKQVLAGEPIDVTMGHFNALWQGDSNAMTLRAFDHASTPPAVFNLAGPETLSVRQCVTELGQLLDRPVTTGGTEACDALLSDGRHGYECLGDPRVPFAQMLGWIADWQARGGESLDKPTHFQMRDGKF